MSANDDEPIALPPGAKPIVPRRVKLVIRNNFKAPLEGNNQKVMLELTGYERSRLGLDLVVVLDLCSNMNGDKLAELKTAMLFVIKKLSVVDHLSIVEYSSLAKSLCPLREMTESSQSKLENLIKNLDTGLGTNITDGLEMALKVLKGRSVSSERVGAIMLMLGGEENIGNAAAVLVENCNIPSR